MRVHRSCQHLENSVNRFFRGDAEASHEVAADSAFFEEACHLLAAAVNHGYADARGRNGPDLPREILTRHCIVEEAPPDLDKSFHEFYRSPAVSSMPSARFRF